MKEQLNVGKEYVILYIDTSNRDQTIVGLRIGEKELKKINHNTQRKSQVVLGLVDSVLKEAKLRLKDIDEIKVKKGPGSFTGLRVGISIANALSFALGVGVNEKKLGEIELPAYA